MRPSFNFSQLSVHRETFRQLSTRTGVHTLNSVNFRCDQETFSEFSLTFLADSRPSINFRLLLCSRETFRQHSFQPVQFPSTSINFLCGWETFCQLPSTFRAYRRTSVNFRHLSVPPGRPSVNFCLLSVHTGDLPSSS